MATKGKGKASKAVSMLPDEMAQGGLADKFWGRITEVRAIAWDYNGKRPDLDPVLAIRVKITPDEGQEVTDEVVEFFTAGDLDFHQPSNDGDEPLGATPNDEDCEGTYVVPVGNRPALNNNSNWAQWIGWALKAGFPRENVAPNVDCFEDMHAFFSREEQKKRENLDQGEPADGQKKRPRTILVPTEIDLGGKKGAKPAAAKAAAKPAAKKQEAEEEAEAEVSESDSAVADIVVEALQAAKDNSLPKGKLTPFVIKGYKGSDKPAMIKRVATPEFLEAFPERWYYDADSGTLTLVEE